MTYEQAETRLALYVDGTKAPMPAVPLCCPCAAIAPTVLVLVAMCVVPAQATETTKLVIKKDPAHHVLAVGWCAKGLIKGRTGNWVGELDLVSYHSAHLTPSEVAALHSEGPAEGAGTSPLPLLYGDAFVPGKGARELRQPARLGSLSDDFTLALWTKARQGVLWSHTINGTQAGQQAGQHGGVAPAPPCENVIGSGASGVSLKACPALLLDLLDPRLAASDRPPQW